MLAAIIKTLPLINCYHKCVHNAEVRQGDDPFTETCLRECSTQKGMLKIKGKEKHFGLEARKESVCVLGRRRLCAGMCMCVL